MRIVNATPPSDFPDQVIVLDRELAQRHRERGFSLRVQVSKDRVDQVDLDGETTLPGAVSAAVAKGYFPSHWLVVGSGDLMLLPDSVVSRDRPRT